MTKPQDLIGVVKDLAACDCYCDEDDESLCDPCQRILEVFRPAAEALLIAVEALEEIEWQSHDHFCYVCTAKKCKGHWPDCPIGKALSRIRSSI